MNRLRPDPPSGGGPPRGNLDLLPRITTSMKIRFFIEDHKLKISFLLAAVALGLWFCYLWFGWYEYFDFYYDGYYYDE